MKLYKFNLKFNLGKQQEKGDNRSRRLEVIYTLKMGAFTPDLHE